MKLLLLNDSVTGPLPLGSAASPSLSFVQDSNTGIYSPGADQVAISTGGTGRLFIDSSGRVGIGTNSPSGPLQVSNASDAVIDITNTGTGLSRIRFQTSTRYFHVGLNDAASSFTGAGAYSALLWNSATTPIVFATDNTQRAQIDASGRLLVGTSTARSNFFNTSNTVAVQVEGTSYQTGSLALIATGNASFDQGTLVLAKGRGSAVGANSIVQSGDATGYISFQGNDGSEFVECAVIKGEVDGTPGANDMPGRLVFSTTADGAASPTERMRIDSSGNTLVGTIFTNTATANIKGISLQPGGFISACRESGPVGFLNRKLDDGDVILIGQDGTVEGSISVSGTTVSYNGAHLSRWSQLPSGAEREEILRGSVLTNIDEMCEWGEEDNEQLNRMKVSDVEGDKNVAGVFQAWDDDDDTYTNDFYCAMTGDFVIRIADGVTVERGDLLMSAGNGTAKPQDDDIIRSKTIAKVTSTNVSCTYEDGSYCVPCVLMAC
jgi:hypothetical protein